MKWDNPIYDMCILPIAILYYSTGDTVVWYVIPMAELPKLPR